MNRLADYNNLVVVRKANILARGHTTTEDKTASLFFYVRDNIKFQFTDEGVLVKE